jgi:hypothetical protein
MVYAVERESMGRTRSVPSLGPVLESDVHPCQARKTEHALLSLKHKLKILRTVIKTYEA